MHNFVILNGAALLWNVMLCSLVCRTYILKEHTENGGSTFLQNVAVYLPILVGVSTLLW